MVKSVECKQEPLVQKLARVSSNGQVVILVSIRRKYQISKTVQIKEERGEIILEPAMSFSESFGDGGDMARHAAI
ncbi:MAG: AbrB/MazE/SpoVT family DNA-binding domain-containing protein, partial [Nitrososphaerota archaeon]|nr:AbrB/MazE/SpoVT family DNA-binding domain-containing protein [Nitrososphaerota archaeon]